MKVFFKIAGEIFLGFGVIFLLFILTNVGAYYYLMAKGSRFWNPADVFHGLIVSPTAAQGREILKKAYGKESENIVAAFHNAPYFSPHTVLHYIVSPVNNEYYTVGLEGARYFDNMSNEKLKNNLKSNNTVFMFGGSTTFGHGLSNNKTLPYFVNQSLLKDGLNVINFGAQAYDQTREIDKLVYLLRAGYRPKAVVFLDGFNDIIGMARSNYRPQDKIVYHGYATGKGDISLGDKVFFRMGSKLDGNDFRFMLLNSMPIYQLYLNYKRPALDASKFKPEKNAFVDPIDYLEMEANFFNWSDFGMQNIELMQSQIVQLYSDNINFLQHLSKIFKFKLLMFYQPIGYLDKNNPFITAAARETPGYNYFLTMDQEIRSSITSETLKLIDISQSINFISSKGTAYIDAAHYSPEANQHLADIIVSFLQENFREP